MKTTLTSKNVSLTETMKLYVEEKITSRVAHLAGAGSLIESALDLEVGRDTRHHRKGVVWEAKATFSLGKNALRAEARGESFQEAVDFLEEELVREIKTSKGKYAAEERRGARRAKKNATIAKAARFYRKGRIREEGI